MMLGDQRLLFGVACGDPGELGVEIPSGVGWSLEVILVCELWMEAEDL
jgi:hypothetical protein